MRSSLPKVLHDVAGRSLLGHVLAAADSLDAERTVVVVGHGRERVEQMLAERFRRLVAHRDTPDDSLYDSPDTPGATHSGTTNDTYRDNGRSAAAGSSHDVFPGPTPQSQSPNGFHPPRTSGPVTTVVQERQGGTGHAVRVAMSALADLPDKDVVVVMPGDTPLLTSETLLALVAEHEARGASATVLTATVPDADGYGRVVRSHDGGVRAIVEHRDADTATLAVDEINAGVYAFTVGPLLASLARLSTANAQGEEYVTEVVELLVRDGETVAAHRCPDADEVAGVNDRVQLAAAGRVLRDRIVTAAMLAGATIVDPGTTWIDAEVTVEPDTTIWPNTYLLGRTRLGRGCVVGPDCSLTDTVVGAGAVVRRTTAEDSEIGANAKVGPYSHLRAGTLLGAGGKLGAFVETKAAEFGEGAKVPHLSYVGDAVVGARSNIGCTAVFVNYDGVDKHRTVIGSDVRIGSDTMLIAPVTVGDGAYTAAGAVIKEDVPPGALAVREGRQRNIEGWVGRRRPGSPAARAASEAQRETGHSNGSNASVRTREA